MHPCFNTDEIARLIVYVLARLKREVDAVATACCCERIEDPVLDSLWEDAAWLIELLGVFPKDAWDHREDNVCLLCVVTTFAF